MLIVQHCTLYWDKLCRGAPHASAHNRFAESFPLPPVLLDHWPEGHPCHYLCFWQNKSGIHERVNKRVQLTDDTAIQVDAVELVRQDDSYQVFYRGKADVLLKRLRSFAFVLEPGEYGRVCYNDKYYDLYRNYDYYGKSVINLIFVEDDAIPPDIFQRRTPDKTCNLFDAAY